MLDKLIHELDWRFEIEVWKASIEFNDYQMELLVWSFWLVKNVKDVRIYSYWPKILVLSGRFLYCLKYSRLRDRMNLLVFQPIQLQWATWAGLIGFRFFSIRLTDDLFWFQKRFLNSMMQSMQILSTFVDI